MWPHEKIHICRNGKLEFLKRKLLGIYLYCNLSQTSPLDLLLPQGGNTLPKHSSKTQQLQKRLFSYLEYISKPNVHSECFIFTSVALHINVWYWKIWWANSTVLPIFILHSHFWRLFLKFYLLTSTEDMFLNWGHAISILNLVELRKKRDCAFLKHSHSYKCEP